jgi:hypothetical protein
MKQTTPTLGAPSFECPRCNEEAQQTWHWLLSRPNKEFARGPDGSLRGKAPNGAAPDGTDGKLREEGGLSMAVCQSCKKPSLWLQDAMVYPHATRIRGPAADMPVLAKEYYNEARNVCDASPRAAAALLRMALEALCDEVESEGSDLASKVAFLTNEGLPPAVLEGIGMLNLLGRDTRHAGLIDPDQDRVHADALFKVLNIVVEYAITLPGLVKDFRDLGAGRSGPNALAVLRA